jgi:hypothetical protein
MAFSSMEWWLRKRFPRFDGPKMILIVFMVCWGIAMFLVLGVIVYLPILMAQTS